MASSSLARRSVSSVHSIEDSGCLVSALGPPFIIIVYEDYGLIEISWGFDDFWRAFLPKPFGLANDIQGVANHIDAPHDAKSFYHHRFRT